MISPRRLEERELRKERILEGALQVFQKNGLEGATMDHIAQEAGFGKATLYYYFSSKEEVFCDIMEKGWIPLWEGIEDEIHSSESARVAFLKILHKIVEITLTDRNLYQFLFTAPKAITHIPENLQTWRVYQNRLYGALQGLVEEGMAKGEFPNLDPELFFRALGGLFHGLLFLGDNNDKVSEKEIEGLFSRFLTMPDAAVTE